MDNMKNWLISLVNSALPGFDQMVNESVQILGGDLVDWNNMEVLSGYLKAFCLVIIGICLLIEIAQIAAKVDTLKWEDGLKVCVKMVLAKVCVDKAPLFLRACFMQAQAWITSFATTEITFGHILQDNLQNMLANQNGMGNVMGLFLTTFILILAISVCGLIIKAVAIGRMFEIYVLLVVSPLPCAFMPLGTGDGVSINRITSKFFKTFIATCLHGVMMLIVLNVFDLVVVKMMMQAMNNYMATGTEADMISMLFTALLGSFTLVMSVTQSGSWAKSIMDAA